MAHPNIVWITMESTRYDHTSLAGYDRDTTPNLRRIADRSVGTSFGNCYSTATWTPASTASILTGTYLSEHTVGIHSPTVNKLPESLDTLPKLLSELGYNSLGIVNNAYITAGTGLDRGFDDVLDPGAGNLLKSVGMGAVFHYLRNIGTYGPGLTTDRALHKIAPMTTYAAKKWLRSAEQSEDPFFLYVHHNDSHYNYSPPEPFLDRFVDGIDLTYEETIEMSRTVFDDVFQTVADGLNLSPAEMEAIVAAYDAELAYVDHFIGELFDYVESNVSGDTIFIVTGDHGEVFGEYGWLGHHVISANELFSVPLVVHGLPEIDNRTDDIVQHPDLTTTIARSLGISDDQFQGHDLTAERRDYAIGQSPPWDHDREKLLEKNDKFDPTEYRWDALNCIWDERFKLVAGEDGDELFKLPDETTDVSDNYPDVVADLKTELANRGLGLPKTEQRNPAEFDEQAYERLRNMGYVG